MERGEQTQQKRPTEQGKPTGQKKPTDQNGTTEQNGPTNQNEPTDQNGPTVGTKEEIESIQESLIMDVCEFYGRQYEEGDRGQPSMRATAEKFGIGPLKVKKILASG